MPKKLKQQQTNYNLFETRQSPAETLAKLEENSSLSAAENDPTSCPKCGSRSQQTARPVEHGGKNRYCIMCVDETGEPFYFKGEA